MAKVYVGTSGWMYGDWQGKFYPRDLPQRQWLAFYSQNFKTVEINSTFYHAVAPKTFAGWASKVPEDFIFAVKASRFITHLKKLNAPLDSIKYQFESVKPLGNKLGPILFQFPRWQRNIERLEGFLSGVYRLQSTAVDIGRKSVIRLAFEFRDSSWFSESVYKILRKYNCALVMAESGGHWPSVEVITADFTYLRFHGEGGSYATKYTGSELKVWAGKIKKWQKAGVDVYAYFNNDVGGFAIENAKTLMNLVR